MLREKENCIVMSNCSSNLNGIDLAKFICSIMVFIIHIPPFMNEGYAWAKSVNFGLQHYFCRLAVPFYFVASGFFLFKKMPLYELNIDAIKNYCFKILRLVGTWHILLFVGSTGHLWYLGATVIAVILLSLSFYFRLRFSSICIVASGLYIVGLLGDSYYGIVEPLTKLTFFRYLFKGYTLAFTTTRNGVFMGFIYVLMGALFAYKKINLNSKTALLGFVVSMVCLYDEVSLLKYNDIPLEYNMYIFLLPATFFLFAFTHAVQLKDRAIYKHLRSVGVLVYFIHLFVNKFVSLAISASDRYFGVEIRGGQFVIALSLTLLIATCIELVSCKQNFKWVRWLFS